MILIGHSLKNFSAIEKTKIFFGPTPRKNYSTMTTGHHTDDDFAFHAREIARQRGQNPDSLHKRAKLVVGEPTITRAGIGPETIAAILNTGVEFSSDAIGPSDFYLRTGRLEFGPTPSAPDLMYRPNDRITLHDIQKAQKILGTASVNYANGTGTKPSAQVGGTHYGDPATDVYAFSMANGLDPMQFNIVKYVTRFRKKDGLKDLKKALQTLERLIAHEEAK